MIAVVARPVEDGGGEDGVGVGDGQGREHGVHQRGSVDGSEPIHLEPVHERSGRDVRGRSIRNGRCEFPGRCARVRL